METQQSAPIGSQFTDIIGLRLCGLFPAGKEPSIRTLRDWTKLRRIPHHRVGHFIYYDPLEVATHITHDKTEGAGAERVNHSLCYADHVALVFPARRFCFCQSADMHCVAPQRSPAEIGAARPSNSAPITNLT